MRWCPGCGNYAVLAAVQRLLPKLGLMKENIVFISGIGCASRFPYYMDTYGFHTIHGRATSIATGLKLTRPELSVWVVIGDGDGLSIGLGHLLHLIRRNIDVNILLLNNQIYGLTKGQFSPTTNIDQVTVTSPYGTLDEPFNPLSLALVANCGFVARAIDIDTKRLTQVLTQAYAYPGTTFIEILQNCHIYHDNAFSIYTNKSVQNERCIFLECDKSLRFGKKKDKGLTWDHQNLQITKNITDQNQHKLIQHRPSEQLSTLQLLLAKMSYPEYPVGIGVFRCAERNTHEALSTKQKNKHSLRSLKEILNSGQSWKVY